MRRTLQPGWQLQNCFCLGTALLRPGSVACQNALVYLFAFENVYNKKHVHGMVHASPKSQRGPAFSQPGRHKMTVLKSKSKQILAHLFFQTLYITDCF
jgi:hypothetical protein